MNMDSKDLKEKAQSYHKNLPERIRKYLNERMISDEILAKYLIGWNGRAITIPITNRAGEIIFFKYRRDPADTSNKDKYWYDTGSHTELYGWENINKPFVVLSEGEFDRLALESQGIPAITTTGGAGKLGKLEPEWIKDLEKIPGLFVCADCDEAGGDNAEKALISLPNAKCIILSGLPEGKKDITDFFVAGNTKEVFLKLIKEAKTLDELNFYFGCLLEPEIITFNPSQDFIKNTGYFSIPSIEYKEDAKPPFRQVYYVITSEKKLLRLDNQAEFYKKYKLYPNHLPAIKNPETRWQKESIKKFLFDGHVPEPRSSFQNIKEIFIKYSEMKEENWYLILPLWVIGTYFYTIFETYPYLSFEGLKNTGKSKTTRIVTRFAFNGILSLDLSEATLFRDIESLRCTLGIDEAEILKDKEKSRAIRAILNAGYYKGARVGRQEKTQKGGFLTRYYETYSPKAIANTMGLEDTLESRAIKIRMLRAKGPSGLILDTENSENWNELRHTLYCFALSYFKEIRNIYLYDPSVKIANNRYNDLWCPLLSIAKFIHKDDGRGFTTIKKFAEEQIGLSQEDSLDDNRTALLRALQDLTKDGDRTCCTDDIISAMGTYLDLKEQESIDKRWIGWRLSDFNLNKKEGEKTRLAKGFLYRFKKKDIEDVIQRFLDTDKRPT